eukprot:1176811-Prorocentrum_minimum.AAC.2
MRTTNLQTHVSAVDLYMAYLLSDALAARLVSGGVPHPHRPRQRARADGEAPLLPRGVARLLRVPEQDLAGQPAHHACVVHTELLDAQEGHAQRRAGRHLQRGVRLRAIG